LPRFVARRRSRKIVSRFNAPQGGDGMGFRFPIAHDKVLLQNLKAGAQTTNDISRRTDQKVGEDLNGFGIEGL